MLSAKAASILARVKRLLEQKRKDKNKLYSLHAPELECISKGKARQPYEFGVKVAIAAKQEEGLMVGMRRLPGNPYDAQAYFTEHPSRSTPPLSYHFKHPLEPDILGAESGEFHFFSSHRFLPRGR